MVFGEKVLHSRRLKAVGLATSDLGQGYLELARCDFLNQDDVSAVGLLLVSVPTVLSISPFDLLTLPVKGK